MNYDIVTDETPSEVELEEDSPDTEGGLSEEELRRLQEAKDRQVERNNLRRKLKLITPAVMLSAGAVISIYTYLRGYLLGDFLVIVFGTLLLFFGIGLLIEYLVVHFVRVNWLREDIRREERGRVREEEERRRLAEELRLRQEREASGAEPAGEMSEEELAAYAEGLTTAKADFQKTYQEK